MNVSSLSIQELRQALRERGSNSRGSKKQLMQRLEEMLAFQDRQAQPPVAKVRVTVHRSRNEACMLLVDPSLPPDTNLQSIRDRAKSKFRFKPQFLYGWQAGGAGVGAELTADNLQEQLQDGLAVLASATRLKSANAAAGEGGNGGQGHERNNRVGSPTDMAEEGEEDAEEDMAAHMAQLNLPVSSSSSHPTKDPMDSGSCSSELEDGGSMDGRSFDSDSLYSYHSAQEAAEEQDAKTHTAAPPHSHPAGRTSDKKKQKWSWMPQAVDQQAKGSSSSSQPLKPPTHPPASPPLHPATSQLHAPAPVPAVPASNRPPPRHVHRNHKCAAGSNTTASTTDVSSSVATSASAPAATAAFSSSSSSPSSSLPSLMDELSPYLSLPSTLLCSCCVAGCDIDWPATPTPTPPLSASAATPLVRSASTPSPHTPLAQSATAAEGREESATPQVSSTSPPSSSSATAPSSTPLLASSASSDHLSSFRVLELQQENRRLSSSLSCLQVESEKSRRRLESKLKSLTKSESDLRLQVSRLESSTNNERVSQLEKEYQSLKLGAEVQSKEMSKVTWERDRLRTKNRTLQQRNEELKAEVEAMEALKKEHAEMAKTLARLQGQHVNDTTPPTVLQDLLLLHTNALHRVHQQMSLNLARDRKELAESRQCKVCMSHPCDTILLPCSHIVMCGLCASNVKQCPVCRTHAQSKRPVYF